MGASQQSPAPPAHKAGLQDRLHPQGRVVPGPRLLGQHQVQQLEEDVRAHAAQG